MKTLYDYYNYVLGGINRFLIAQLIKRSLGKCGNAVRIGRGFRAFGIRNIEIGDNVYIGEQALIMTTGAKVKISDHVMFGPRVTIVSGNHRTDVVGRYMTEIKASEKRLEDDRDIIFEGDNWIGANSLILAGVTIGRGSVVAGGAVVTQSIPPFSIWGGVPARCISSRFNDEELEEHLNIMKCRNGKQ